jgi:hypothetical protein
LTIFSIGREKRQRRKGKKREIYRERKRERDRYIKKENERER